MPRLKTFFLILLFFLLPTANQIALGQEIHQDFQGAWKAKVEKVVSEEKVLIPGTDTETVVQVLEARIMEGERSSEIISLQNDYIPLKIGDTFFLNFLITIDGREIFSVRDVDRRPTLIIFSLLFAFTILIFGGWQGLRALLGLFGTFLVIIYILLPLLLNGYPPVLTSTLIATVVLFLAIYFTHGFNRESTVAFTGTILAVSITSVLAFLSVKIGRLSGFASDEAIYLNFSTFGQLDLSGLLLAGIIIGVLGVLDDIAITQSAVVSELYGTNPNLSKKEVYNKALRVGREHAGALVNTLALAYTGAALPLLMLFSISESSIGMIVNQEVFALEILRTIVGSIGLVLTIPITTLIAVFVLEKYKGQKPKIEHHHHH